MAESEGYFRSFQLGLDREPAPELITGTEARELVTEAFGEVRRKLADRSAPSIRAELEDVSFAEDQRRAWQSELLEGGIVDLRLDVLVMKTSRGDYEALPLAGTAAVRATVLAGKVNLTEMAADDPRLPQLRLHEGKPVRYRTEQLEPWLARPEVKQRMAAMLLRPFSTASPIPLPLPDPRAGQECPEQPQVSPEAAAPSTVEDRVADYLKTTQATQTTPSQRGFERFVRGRPGAAVSRPALRGAYNAEQPERNPGGRPKKTAPLAKDRRT